MRPIDADRLKYSISLTGDILEKSEDDVVVVAILKIMIDTFIKIIDKSPTLPLLAKQKYDCNHDCDALKEITQKWIPCSERLPEENGRYLVTRGLKACDSLWNRVYIVNYSDLMGLCKEKIWWSGNVGKSDFERHDNVLAWMPLPEPYKTETENANVCNGCYYNDGKVHAECVVYAKTEKKEINK